MKKYVPLAIAIALAVSPLASAQEIFRETVHLGQHLTTTVWVGYNPNYHRAQVVVRFVTDDGRAYNVNCLSVYRDIKYVLRDASGRVMPLNLAAAETHIDTTTEVYTEYKCEDLPTSWREKDSSAFLGDLYPAVPAGTYTLEISVAPRNLPQSATLVPISVRL